MGVIRAAVGTRLGPYELLERLGVGGMAEVYAARRHGPRGFAKRVALKCILPQLAKDARLAQMFCDEARVMAALTHPNLVQVIDFGEVDRQLYMALEYVEGLSCARLLRSVAAQGGAFPHGAALHITHEVLSGLSYAHDVCDEEGQPLGIVHRDVSPGNILLGRAGTVKLTDFGILQSEIVEARTNPGELKGKLGYMSPEQVIGGELDRRSDLFTLGIVLAEMLLARPLFPGRNELEILTRIYECDTSVLDRHGSGLPGEILGLLRRALARAPEARFQNALEFRGALRMVAGQLGIESGESELLPWLHASGVLPPQSGTRPMVRVSGPGRRPGSSDTSRSGSRPRLPAVAPEERPRPRLTQVVHVPEARVLRGAGCVGPIPGHQLLGMVATGHISATERVSIDAGPFVPLGRHPSLIRQGGRRLTDWEPVAQPATWETELTPIGLLGSLLDLVIHERSGLFEVVVGRRRKRLVLAKGRIVSAASSDRGELLGAQLVHRGLVSQADVEQALSTSLQSGRRLGEELAVAGVLRPALVLRAALEQLEGRVLELGTWRSGRLAFYQSSGDVEATLGGPPNSLALVWRMLDECYPEAELMGILGPLMTTVLRRERRPAVERALIHAERFERSLFEFADTPRTGQQLVEGLMRDGRLAAPTAMRAVLLALAAGLLLSVPGSR